MDDALLETMSDYVTGGLTRAEREAVSRRLESGDEAAIAALATALEAYASVGRASGAATPSAQAWDTIAAAVGAGAQRTSTPVSQDASPPALHAVAVPRSPAGRPAGRRPRAAWGALAAAAAVAFVAVWWGFTQRAARMDAQSQLVVMATDRDAARRAVTAIESELLDLRQRESRTRDELRLLAEQFADTRLELASLRGRVDADADRLAFLTSPTLNIDQLAGTEAQPDARARMAWDARLQRFRFEADGLQPVAPGRTYQLWAISSEDTPVSLGTFVRDDRHPRTVYEGELPGLTAAPAAIAVSVEPAGGVPQPTGAIQLVGEVTSVQ